MTNSSYYFQLFAVFLDFYSIEVDQTSETVEAGACDKKTGSLHGVCGGSTAHVPLNLLALRSLVRSRLVLHRHLREGQRV